jgi:hypothetical protein
VLALPAYNDSENPVAPIRKTLFTARLTWRQVRPRLEAIEQEERGPKPTPSIYVVLEELSQFTATFRLAEV